MTTDPDFKDSIGRPCSGDHPHAVCQGRDSERTAFYTEELCVALARHFVDVINGVASESFSSSEQSEMRALAAESSSGSPTSSTFE